MNCDDDVLVIIPARYASTRLPGKPLAKICGEEIILHVCRQVSQTGYRMAVATDDDRIFNCVRDAGYRAIMTDCRHTCGTERIAEALETLHSDAGIIVNVQGDEPMVSPDQIRAVVSVLKTTPSADIATMVYAFDSSRSYSELQDPHRVKVELSSQGNVINFSRSVIPWLRGESTESWPSKCQYYTHIGIYAFRANVLREVVKLPRSPLEIAERLEQMRWLENGYRISAAVTGSDTIGIDTPADLDRVRKLYDNNRSAK
ncbi:MAG: 3-deoxy-manno-octulosonate cytidylyltransferase [Bacteroidales bacterium]|nr:3-deoxy-manno-octulosonate cytidylyltransferase [Bacteroidales bacterium]